MIVTTSTRGQTHLEGKAIQVAQEMRVPFIKRGRSSLAQMIGKYEIDKLLMVTSEGVKCVFRDKGTDPFFFHPSSAMFRIKRLMGGDRDPFVETTQLTSGMTFLDCTLGLASDSIVASYVVGPTGRVNGLESQEVLAYLVRDGLRTWDSKIEKLNDAMRGIQVTLSEHATFLRDCPANSYDVVYFDPMFETTKNDSIGLSPLKKIANYDKLHVETVKEACRVAKQRVVMKESSYSLRFQQLGFQPVERKYASHWFGTIELEKIK
jgi:hypothetical protein